MKKFFSSKQILAALTCCAVAAGCKKDNEYRNMSPVQEVHMSSYDFIKNANKSGLYDTLLYLLDKTGLADKLKTGKYTFFAPQDFSITSAMNNLNFTRKKRGEADNWTVDSVRLGVWDTLLNRYVVEGIYNLDSLRYGDGVTLMTPHGYEMSGRVENTAASGIEAGSSAIIEYSDKNNSRLTKFWVTTTTESTNLKTTNGMVHMLTPKHVFGFTSFLPMAYPAKMSPFFGTPFLIPGIGSVDNAYFDKGGEGIAYHDFEPLNRGSAKYRFEEGVDTDNNTGEGGYNIGFTFPGEWLNYSVRVEHSGMYASYGRVATPNIGCFFHLEVDGKDVSGLLPIPKGTGYQDWKTVQGADVYLEAGEHVATFFVDGAGFNMARFGFLPKFRKPFNAEPLKIPGTIPMAEFDWGGEGIGYKDVDAQNRGNAKHLVRAFEGPDIEVAPEGGFNFGYTAAGEWTLYTVNVLKPGKYDIVFRVASPNTTAKLHAEIDGANVTGVLTVPRTGAYATYTDLIKKDVTLTGGIHDLKVVVDAAGHNISKITFVAK